MSTFFTVLAVLAVVAAPLFSFHYKIYKTSKYKCEKCSTEFKPKFIASVFATNTGDGKIIKCPGCNRVEKIIIINNDQTGGL